MMGRVLPTLVLLHGFTQTRQSWRRTAQALAGRYRALVPDLPGHGQALHRTASFDACAAYVRAVAPTRTFTLAGYSMGGRIALHSALVLGPSVVTRLVLVGASPGLGGPVRARRAAGVRRRAGRAARDAGHRDLRARVGRTAAVRGPAGARRRGRARGPAAQHAGRARRGAARPRHRRDGAALGPVAGARDPGHARGRRARREVPRARRGDARAAPERARCVVVPGTRATPRSSRTRPRSRQRSTNRARPLRRPPRSRRGRSRLPGGRRTPRRRA